MNNTYYFKHAGTGLVLSIVANTSEEAHIELRAMQTNWLEFNLMTYEEYLDYLYRNEDDSDVDAEENEILDSFNP